MLKGKYAPKSLLIRSLIILLGTVITAFGCAAFVISASLGLDPVSAFLIGVGSRINLSYGNTLNALNVILLVFLLIFNRKMLHIGTVIYTLLVGIFCDLFIAMLGSVLGPDPGLVIKVIFLLVAIVTFSFGLGLYQASQLGAGPIDGFNQTISKWTRLPLKYERIAWDVLMALIGFLLGSTIFVGTILAMFAIGPIMGPTIVKMSPVIDRWTGVEPNNTP